MLQPEIDKKNPSHCNCLPVLYLAVQYTTTVYNYSNTIILMCAFFWILNCLIFLKLASTSNIINDHDGYGKLRYNTTIISELAGNRSTNR